jgi:hypothetical protein
MLRRLRSFFPTLSFFIIIYDFLTLHDIHTRSESLHETHFLFMAIIHCRVQSFRLTQPRRWKKLAKQFASVPQKKFLTINHKKLDASILERMSEQRKSDDCINSSLFLTLFSSLRFPRVHENETFPSLAVKTNEEK